jgi:uncharacterized protein with beta-barrel porin domain
MKACMVIFRSIKQLLSLIALLSLPLSSLANNYVVSSAGDDGSIGTLRYIINQINSSGTVGSAASNNIISINPGLTAIILTSNLPVIQNNGVTIVGPTNGQTISGANTYRLLATYNASLSLSNLTLYEGLALGGNGSNGGGGGAGGGGAIYIDSGSLSVSNVNLQNCMAQGGNGAAQTTGTSGGGGGASWSIGNSNATATSGGGDYPGVGVSGGGVAYSGSLAGYGGGDGGSSVATGTGGIGGGTDIGANANNDNGGDGGYCGGGGGASDPVNNSAGGGGGNGGGNGSTGTYSGGGGGGYGSGGAGNVGTNTFGGGGGGGFGGGGGSGSSASTNGPEAGGGGGFGGGGGTGAIAGQGGNFGGDAVASNVGGGAAGLGGSIFASFNTAVLIGDAFSSTSNSAAGGTGGNNGTGFANDIFLFQGASVQFVGGSNQTVTFAIQADVNSPAGKFDAGVLINTSNNAIITMNANNNNYKGGTTIQAGTLIVATGALPTIGSVTIDALATLTLQTNTVATTGTMNNAGNLNLQAAFTPANYTSFTNTGTVYVIGLGSIVGDLTAGGTLSIGQDSTRAANTNIFSTSHAINIPSINVYNTSSLISTGSVTADLYMLNTATFSGTSITGTMLTTGKDSSNNPVSGTAFAASGVISGFPTINVSAGTFSTNGFAISNVNTAFNIANGATATFDAIVSGTGDLNVKGILNNSVINGIDLTGLVTIAGTLNVVQNLTLANNINCSGNISVSSGQTLTSNGSLFLYNNAVLSGDIAGGGASVINVGQDSLGTNYVATNSTINSNLSGIETLNIINGTLSTAGTITGLNTALNIQSGAAVIFNAAVTGTVAASNLGTLTTYAPLNFNSYTSSGTTQFAITNASIVGSINTGGAVDLGTNTSIVNSNFINAVAGSTYNWTIVTAGSITPATAQLSLPTNTIANTWSSTQNATTINVSLKKGALHATNQILGPIINAMSLNPANQQQFILIDALGRATSQAQLTQFIDQLIPEQNTSVVNVLKQGPIFNRVSRRISAVREELAANEVNGFVAGDIDESKAIWVAPFGSYAKQDPTDNNFGYRSYLGGIILGLDLQRDDKNLFGIALANSNANVQTQLIPGPSTRIVGHHVLFYGNHVFNKAKHRFLDWMVTGVVNVNRGERQIVLAGVNYNTSVRYHSYQGGALLNFGQTYNYNENYKITPLAMLEYNIVRTPAYSETSGSAAALYVRNNRFRNVFTAGFGSKLTFKTKTRAIKTKPSLEALLSYDLINSKETTTANFLAGGPAFTYTTSPSRLGLTLGADCVFETNDRMSLQLSYEFQARSGYRTHTGMAKFRFLF